MQPLFPAVADFFFQTAAGEIQPVLVEIGRLLIGTRDPNHHWGVVSHVSESRFTLAQRFLNVLKVGDVNGRTHVTNKASIRRKPGESDRLEPAILTVSAAEANLRFERRLHLECATVSVDVSCNI